MFDDIILNASLKFEVPGAWIRAIITQESAWDKNAMRYEAGFKYILDAPKFAKINRITAETEVQCQKFSWGLGQLMGGLLREMGHTRPLCEVLDPNLNIQFIAQRIQYLKKCSKVEDDIFAMYNGGLGAIKKVHNRYRNQVYVDSVKQHLQTIVRGDA